MGINDVSDQLISFKMYPTIVDNLVNLEFELSDAGPLRVEIYSVEGKLIQILEDSNYQANYLYKKSHALDISSGLYFVKVHTKQNSAELRIIKQ